MLLVVVIINNFFIACASVLTNKDECTYKLKTQCYNKSEQIVFNCSVLFNFGR